MYKRKSQAMQRYHQVGQIDAQPVSYRTQDDLLPDLDSMALSECEAERARLMHEKARAEQELVSAKRQRDTVGVDTLGLRIQGFCNRMSALKGRIKTLSRDFEHEALSKAMKDVLDRDTFGRLIARKNEIRDDILAGRGEV